MATVSRCRGFACSQCDYSANSIVALQYHVKAKHEKLKNFKCEFCGYKTTHKYILNNHVKSIHEKIKNHSCPQCDYKCYQLGSLKSHISKNHSSSRVRSAVANLAKSTGAPRTGKGSQRASPKTTTTSKCCVRITASERELPRPREGRSSGH